MAHVITQNTTDWMDNPFAEMEQEDNSLDLSQILAALPTAEELNKANPKEVKPEEPKKQEEPDDSEISIKLNDKEMDTSIIAQPPSTYMPIKREEGFSIHNEDYEEDTLSKAVQSPFGSSVKIRQKSIDTKAWGDFSLEIPNESFNIEEVSEELIAEGQELDNANLNSNADTNTETTYELDSYTRSQLDDLASKWGVGIDVVEKFANEERMVDVWESKIYKEQLTKTDMFEDTSLVEAVKMEYPYFVVDICNPSPDQIVTLKSSLTDGNFMLYLDRGGNKYLPIKHIAVTPRNVKTLMRYCSIDQDEVLRLKKSGTYKGAYYGGGENCFYCESKAFKDTHRAMNGRGEERVTRNMIVQFEDCQYTFNDKSLKAWQDYLEAL